VRVNGGAIFEQAWVVTRTSEQESYYEARRRGVRSRWRTYSSRYGPVTSKPYIICRGGCFRSLSLPQTIMFVMVGGRLHGVIKRGREEILPRHIPEGTEENEGTLTTSDISVQICGEYLLNRNVECDFSAAKRKILTLNATQMIHVQSCANVIFVFYQYPNTQKFNT
jgi:hypothetical protein